MSASAANTPLTHLVAEFAHGLRFEQLPAGTVRAAKEHLLDALGVGLAAASLSHAEGVRRAVRSLGQGGQSTGLGCAEPLPAPSAALLNGVLTHSLEYDDTHVSSVIHGSSVIVPAALAVTEREGAGGRDLLLAIVLGWELLVRLGLAAPGRFQSYGFQITSVGGPFAAALVSALLQRLDVRQTVSAMGIAGSQSSGVFEYLSDGSTVKSLHPGWAAHGGVVAGALAQGGMTGPATIFEGRFGLYATHGRSEAGPQALRELMGGLGSTWYLPEAYLKAYPCCHYIHPFLECLEQLLAEGLRPADIAAVDCQVSAGMTPIVCEPWERKVRPVSGYDAKFSLPYCLAAYLVNRQVDVDTFDTVRLPADVLAMAERVHYTADADADTDFPRRFPAALQVRLKSGDRLGRAVPNVRGGADRPLSAAEVEAKFRSNALRTLRPEAVERVQAEVMRLEQAASLEPLVGALRSLA